MKFPSPVWREHRRTFTWQATPGTVSSWWEAGRTWYGASLLARLVGWKRRHTIWLRQTVVLRGDFEDSGRAATKIGIVGVADWSNGMAFGGRKPTRWHTGMSVRWRVRQRGKNVYLGLYFYHLGQSRSDGYGDIFWLEQPVPVGEPFRVMLAVRLGSRLFPRGSIRAWLRSPEGNRWVRQADIRGLGWNMTLGPELGVNSWRDPDRRDQWRAEARVAVLDLRVASSRKELRQ